MIRIALASLLLFASASLAEDILQPTQKELLAISEPDDPKFKSLDRKSLIAKYDGKLIKLTGGVFYNVSVANAGNAGIVSKYFALLLQKPEPLPTQFCVIKFGPNTEKVQDQIKDKKVTSEKPLTLTIYGRLQVEKQQGTLTLEGATTDKDKAGKVADAKK